MIGFGFGIVIELISGIVICYKIGIFFVFLVVINCDIKICCCCCCEL